MAAESTLADVKDLEAVLLRPLSEGQGQAALELLTRASALFRIKAPWIDARLADGTVDKLAVATAVAGIVKRVFLNPSALVAFTAGPYSETKQGTGRRGVGNDGDLLVLDSDVQKVLGATPSIGRTIHTKPNLAPRLKVTGDGRLVEDGLAGYPSGRFGVLPAHD